jgi:signal transduction histidine kinase
VTGVPIMLHPEAEIALLRALQESLANVHKHARARSVAATLSYMEDLVVLDVRDDGSGFVPDQLARGGGTAGGFGLRAMRERVEELGGIVSIESEPGEGTTLTVTLPRLHTAEHPIVRRSPE